MPACAEHEMQRRDLSRKNCPDFVEVVVGERRRLDGWRRPGQLLLAGAAVLGVVSRRDSAVPEVLPRAGCPYEVGVRIEGRSDSPQSHDAASITVGGATQRSRR